MTPTLLELFSLRDRVAVVTGAAMGIGEAVAMRLAEAGAAVGLFDVDPNGAEKVAAQIRTLGGRALVCTGDVARAADADQAVEATLRAFGRIDVLVNNAGVFPFVPAMMMQEEEWDHVLDVNLKGAFLVSQRVARVMSERHQGGSIINLASIAAIRPTPALLHYNASKAGVVMLTKSLALELAAEKIRVNAIAPGAVETPGSRGAAPPDARHGSSFKSRIPMNRMAEPDDIARVALFLACPASAYMTGSVLVVDGGYLLT